jgi:small subunit ribosomal protein S13
MKPEIKQEKADEGLLVRILSTDIPGDKRLIVGLTRIKGISWSFSNAICNVLKMDKSKKIKDLTKEEIEKITAFVANPKVPSFILNRRNDIETGENKHIIGSDLTLQREFDIKRLKKMKCYRGIRHSLGQPVRGQKTRSHFRSNKSVGVTKAKVAK